MDRARFHWSEDEALEALECLRRHDGSATTAQIFEFINKRSNRHLVNNSVCSLRFWAQDRFGIPLSESVTCKSEGSYRNERGQLKRLYRYTLCRRLLEMAWSDVENPPQAQGQRPLGPPLQTSLLPSEMAPQ